MREQENTYAECISLQVTFAPVAGSSFECIISVGAVAVSYDRVDFLDSSDTHIQ